MTADDLDSLFTEPPTGGVYRIAAADVGGAAADLDQDDLTDRLTGAGWQVRRLAGIDDRDEFYTEISSRLGFPHYFGRNLDALYDSLRDLGEPTAVIIPWRRLEERDPHWAGRVLAVLSERAARAPAFAVILRG